MRQRELKLKRKPLRLDQRIETLGHGLPVFDLDIVHRSFHDSLLVAGLFRLIDSIKAFPLIFILTNGGPGNVTEVTNYYLFLQAFNFSYLGFSSAMTVALLLATVALSWLIVRLVGWGAHVE